MKSFEAIVTHQRYSKLNSQTHTNLKSANSVNIHGSPNRKKLFLQNSLISPAVTREQAICACNRHTAGWENVTPLTPGFLQLLGRKRARTLDKRKQDEKIPKKEKATQGRRAGRDARSPVGKSSAKVRVAEQQQRGESGLRFGCCAQLVECAHTRRPHNDAQPLEICVLWAEFTHIHTYTTNSEHNTDITVQRYGNFSPVFMIQNQSLFCSMCWYLHSAALWKYRIYFFTIKPRSLTLMEAVNRTSQYKCDAFSSKIWHSCCFEITLLGF